MFDKVIRHAKIVPFWAILYMSTNTENLMKIGPVVAEIFSAICRFLPPVCPKRCSCYHAISGVTVPTFIKFAQDLAKIVPFNIFESKWRYRNPFWNATVPNETGYPNFALKFVTMATSLEESEKKRSRSIIYEHMPIIW